MSAPASERRVLFVCTHNAGRSIVAAERGISLAGVHPKPITSEPAMRAAARHSRQPMVHPTGILGFSGSDTP